MKTGKPIFVVLLCAMLAACGETLLGPDPEDTPEKTFELLWEDFDLLYSFFEVKGIDWDALYATYRPQVTKQTTGQELFQIISAMLSHLKDGHVDLYTPYGEYHYIGEFDPDPFQLSTLKSRYLTTFKGDDTILYGPLKEDLGYIYISTFGGKVESYEIIDRIIEDFKGFKGIVLDVRNNGGGDEGNAAIIASRFADERKLYKYIQWRNGPEHSDFTERFANYINPAGKAQFTKPVVLLTNRRCFSSTEDFILMMRAFPHVTVVGETTGGGSANPVFRELPNGWVYSVSRWIELTADQMIFEGVGLTPDVPASITESDSRAGRDTVLERAIEILEQ